MRLLSGLILIAALTASVPLRAEAAVSARDDQGHEVVLSQPARRVVALAPNAVELLYAVGAGPQVQAVPEGTDYPPEAGSKPKTGSFSNPDEEAIFAARPDLVVLVHGNPKPLIVRLKERGLPVFVCHPKTVADILASMRSLGHLTGHDEEAQTVVGKLQARLDALEQRLAGRKPVRSALLIWDDPITVAGKGAFLHDALRLAGGENIAADLPQAYPTLDPEQLLALRPEAIAFAGHDASKVRDAAAKPGMRGTPAAQNGRIFPVDDNLVLRAGPRLITGIEEIAKGLHPDAFPDGAQSQAATPEAASSDNRTLLWLLAGAVFVVVAWLLARRRSSE